MRDVFTFLGSLFAVIFAVIVLIFLCVIGFSALTSNSPVECAGRTVKAIGGCDQYGSCGVTWSDGKYGQMQHPNIGEACR